MCSAGGRRTSLWRVAVWVMLGVWVGQTAVFAGPADLGSGWTLPCLFEPCGPMPARGARLAVSGSEFLKKEGQVGPGETPSRPLQKNGRPRSRLYLSAGLALSAGVLAFWSKREADQAYDRYLHTASAERQQGLFDRAERYDRIAGAAFVGMEVGLVLTTYLVFF